MKKSILTAVFITLGAIGLMAQSKKADTLKKSTAVPYTLTHKDSVLIQKLIIEAQSNPIEPSLPIINGRLVSHQFTDVIDVEHEIK